MSSSSARPHLVQTEPDLQAAAPAVAVALYREAFCRFGALCLWSTREMEEPTIADALDAAARLKREGNMQTRRFAERMEEACRAAR